MDVNGDLESAEVAAAVAAEVRGGGESDAPAHILADDTERVGTVGEGRGYRGNLRHGRSDVAVELAWLIFGVSVGSAGKSLEPRIALVRQWWTVPCNASDVFWVINVTFSIVSRTVISARLTFARDRVVSNYLPLLISVPFCINSCGY